MRLKIPFEMEIGHFLIIFKANYSQTRDLCSCLLKCGYEFSVSRLTGSTTQSDCWRTQWTDKTSSNLNGLRIILNTEENITFSGMLHRVGR